MQKTNQAGIKLIKKYEGFVSYVYLDCVGFPTIGYGHLCQAGDFYLNGKSLNEIKILCEKKSEIVKELTKISYNEGEKLLRIDLLIAEKAVLRLIKVPLNSNQFSALVSFVYNLGSGALQRSTLRRKLNRGEYFAVPNEIVKWVYADGKKLNGLVNRRLEESVLFLSK